VKAGLIHPGPALAATAGSSPVPNTAPEVSTVNSNDPTHAPLRDVARNPEAYARYLTEVQRTLAHIAKNLETLEAETSLHLRQTHVEGDRWYHAKLRSKPVENALKAALKHLNSLTADLEKLSYRRRAHEDVVANTARCRKEKALERQRKSNPPLPQAPAPAPQQQRAQNQNSGYGAPTSIYDLRGKESA
jgi:hypothetical protein